MAKIENPPTSFRRDAEDERILALLREHYGRDQGRLTNSTIIRLAIRVLARKLGLLPSGGRNGR